MGGGDGEAPAGDSHQLDWRLRQCVTGILAMGLKCSMHALPSG